MTANNRFFRWSSLSRRPVLIAMMVYALAYGVAIFALWRDATSNSSPRTCDGRDLTQGTAGSVRGVQNRAMRLNAAPPHLSI